MDKLWLITFGNFTVVRKSVYIRLRLTPVGSITVHIYTQRVKRLTPGRCNTVHITHKQYTGWHPVAAVDYTLHTNSTKVGTRWQHYSIYLHTNSKQIDTLWMQYSTYYTQTIHKLTPGGSSTVQITQQQYTGWYPLAALQYIFTHKQYTGWHPVGAIQYILHTNNTQVDTRWHQYSTRYTQKIHRLTPGGSSTVHVYT
jgi:hypothetical protein